MNVTVYNLQGKPVGQMSIDEQALGGQINPSLIKQAYVVYHANQRQGSARTQDRGEVAGSTKKIYKQKGTGNARHGSKRANLFKGGGHTFAKKKTREDYHLDMPKKMKRKANRNALLAKLLDNEVKIIDSLAMAEPRTRAFRELMAELNIDRTCLVALSADEAGQNARLSCRNIDDVAVCRADQLTCFEMLSNRYMIIGKRELEAWITGPSSQTGKDARINPLGRSASTSRTTAEANR